jgi:Flp pilus assembly protein TadD
MAKIEIRCTECGHEARVPEAFRGKKVRCLRCRAKLRIPEDAAPGAPRRAVDPLAESGRAKAPRGRPLAQSAGTGASKARREVQQSIREVLGDYEHAIESTSRGFDVDLRGVAFGLARTLAEDLLGAPGVRDVKLAGGTGECRLTITVEGAVFDPADSFADDDDETELFRRPVAPGPAPFEDKLRDEDSGRADEEGSARRGRERETVSAARRKPSAPAETGPPSPKGASAPSRSVEKLLAEAERLLEDGDARRASEVLEQVVSTERNHAAAVHALGQAYARLGDNERARRAFKHLAKLRPEDADPLILHAAACVQCERLEEARLSLADAIKLDPENARAYKYAAVLYERLGDADRSRKFRAKYDALKGR